MSDHDVELALRALARRLEAEPAADLTGAVLGRLTPRPQRRPVGWKVAVVLAAVVLALAGIAVGAIPQLRDAVRDWLGAENVDIDRVATLPELPGPAAASAADAPPADAPPADAPPADAPPTPAPSERPATPAEPSQPPDGPPPTPPGDRAPAAPVPAAPPAARPFAELDLGAPVDVETAEELLGHPLPTSERLGVPAAILATSSSRPAAVTLVWSPTPDLPAPAAVPGIGALLSVVPTGDPNEPFGLAKSLGDDTDVRFTDVGGANAAWIEGAPHVVTLRDGGSDRFRLAANVLLWRVGDNVYRLETSLGFAEARAIARTLTPPGSASDGS